MKRKKPSRWWRRFSALFGTWRVALPTVFGGFLFYMLLNINPSASRNESLTLACLLSPVVALALGMMLHK